VGTKDVTLMHSVAMAGVNAVTRQIFSIRGGDRRRAASGAHRRGDKRVSPHRCWRVDDPGEPIEGLVAGDGGELIAYHAVGTGDDGRRSTAVWWRGYSMCRRAS
jgi:hypothetical protein